jgi:hypothetical protein
VKKLLVAFLISIFSFQSAFALFGTRPMGMGGAFTAVSDDANAPYWNPAGLALNPEVSLTGSTMANNRNTWVGDNVANLKMCYETEMNPFVWIAGVGLASVIALQGAKYLKDQGIVQKGWGREGEKPSREEAVTPQVTGTGEAVSLKQELKETFKKLAGKAAEETKETAKEVAKRTTVNVTIMPWGPPWYHHDYHHPHYFEPREVGPSTKAQFALGISWLNDFNPPLNQKTNWYTLTVASGFEQRIALGAGLNFYDLTRIDTDIRGMGADLDLGFIAKPVEYLSLGLATKGILTTDFHWQNRDVTRGYEMLVNAGIAVKPIYSLTLAADAHNVFNQNNKTATMHYGAEAVLLPGILARAGLNDGNKSAGLSAAFGNLILDYAILGGSYNRTQMIGGTWRF